MTVRFHVLLVAAMRQPVLSEMTNFVMTKFPQSFYFLVFVHLLNVNEQYSVSANERNVHRLHLVCAYFYLPELAIFGNMFLFGATQPTMYQTRLKLFNANKTSK